MAGHILLKFTDYVEDFLRGPFYMNTLHYFWYKYKDKAIKKYLEDHPWETRVPNYGVKGSCSSGRYVEGSVGIGNDPDDELNVYPLQIPYVEQ